MSTQTQSSLDAAALPSARRLPSNRWLLVLVVIVALVGAIFFFPPPYPHWCLLAMLGIGLGVAVRDAGIGLRDLRNARASLVRSRALTAESLARRQRWLYGSLLMALALMGIVAILLRPSPEVQISGVAAFFALLGGLSFGVALRLAPPATILRAPTTAALAPTRAHGGLVTIGVVLLAAVAEISGGLTGILTPDSVSFHAQFVLWLLGVVLTTWGMVGGQGLASVSRLVTRSGRDVSRPYGGIRFASVDRTMLLSLVGLFALAFVLRVWEVENSVRVLIDEIDFVSTITDMETYSDRGLLRPTFGTYLASPAIYSYGQLAAVQVFGHNLLGLRFLSVVVGALTVPALFVLADTLFDRKTAWVAALLLATFPPHLHFSRLALYAIADTLFGTLALAFVARGLKHNRRVDWALGGLSLGLTQYFYEAGKLFYPPLVALWIVVLAIVWRRQISAHWHGITVAAMTAFFIGAPVYYTLIAMGEPLAIRLATSGARADAISSLFANGFTVDALSAVIGRFIAPFTIYVHQPEIREYIYYYGGAQPMVLEYLTPLFLLGGFWALWHWRTPSIVVLLWVVTVGMANGFLNSPYAYPRWVVVFPAVALLMAVALCSLVPLLWSRRSRVPATLPLAALVLLIAAAQATYYFTAHLPAFNRQIHSYDDTLDSTDALLRAADLPDDTRVIFVADPVTDTRWLSPFEDYLRGELSPGSAMMAIPTAGLSTDFLLQLPVDRQYAFFVPPNRYDLVAQIQQVYWTYPPQRSPYPVIPPEKEYQLIVAHSRK